MRPGSGGGSPVYLPQVEGSRGQFCGAAAGWGGGSEEAKLCSRDRMTAAESLVHPWIKVRGTGHVGLPQGIGVGQGLPAVPSAHEGQEGFGRG